MIFLTRNSGPDFMLQHLLDSTGIPSRLSHFQTIYAYILKVDFSTPKRSLAVVASENNKCTLLKRHKTGRVIRNTKQNGYHGKEVRDYEEQKLL